MIFTAPTKEKEWKDLPQIVRESAMKNMAAFTSKMSNEIAIELLSHAFNELEKRIGELEKK